MRPLLRYMPHVFFIGVALMTILSLIPSTSVPQALQFWDKAQHSLAFAALSITGSMAFPRRLKLVCMGLLTHGAVIEVMQSTLTATRFGDVFDWLADGIGVLVGVGLYRYVLAKPAGEPEGSH